MHTTRRARSVLLLIAALILAACQSAAPSSPSAPPDSTLLAEHPIRRIPLRGPLARTEAEISGLAWYGDTLILLPQFPRLHLSKTRGRLFGIPRTQIEAALADSTMPPLPPKEIPIFATNLDAHTERFQGCEALAFRNNRAYLLVEATSDQGMRGYLVAGDAAPDLSAIRFDAQSATPIPIQTALYNMSVESLLAVGDTLVTLYEANGANVNPAPQAHRFDLSLRPLPPFSFPSIEYRITDATEADSAGRFWAINYFFPGDREKLNPASDSVTSRYGTGATHRQSQIVERLIEFQYTPRGIVRTDTPPLLLRLAEGGEARNWEGIARLGGRGFLLATDTFPETILAFVPAPTRQRSHSDDPRRAKSATTGR